MLSHGALPITMEAAFCVKTLERCSRKSTGKSDICNTDQGNQFTGTTFTGALIKRWPCAISMDGKGAWRDNVCVERLWRSVKYEEVSLRAYDSVSEARTYDRSILQLS